MKASTRKVQMVRVDVDRQNDACNDELQRDHPDRSAERYAERSRARRRFKQGDWWIALAIYLLVGSLAIVMF